MRKKQYNILILFLKLFLANATVILVIFYTIAIFISAYAIGEEDKGKINMPEKIAITQSDHGKIFKANQGNLILIRVPENPSTGYCWEINTSDDQIIKFADSDFFMNLSTAIGGGGIRTFTFKAQSPGTAKLELKLRQEWDAKKSETERFEVTIEVQE
ncbi:protease inhibitor I42 family protein [Desulfonema magnum]|uniref:Proteinase inhibitor domain-containing protein n=1 Tax=Desulfonema magnum TaxID=45655 RepID=A0A975BFR7_9BACT|nr:protease inhibitor I42 family protein [Desulfonema magnum]QTA84250.1 Proteinase inhibitor domain-containing protein [Desulfonema magnum]